MSRPGWKTIGIQETVYEEIASKRVPTHSKSVQSYVHHWIRIGLLIDAALDKDTDTSSVVERIVTALAEVAQTAGE